MIANDHLGSPIDIFSRVLPMLAEFYVHDEHSPSGFRRPGKQSRCHGNALLILRWGRRSQQDTN